MIWALAFLGGSIVGHLFNRGRYVRLRRALLATLVLPDSFSNQEILDSIHKVVKAYRDSLTAHDLSLVDMTWQLCEALDKDGIRQTAAALEPAGKLRAWLEANFPRTIGTTGN